MAQIDLNRIEKLDKARNSIHSKVYSTYTAFEEFGEKYLQIDTYGKDERESPAKVSQSFQFDKETAKFIVDLLQKEFGLT